MIVHPIDAVVFSFELLNIGGRVFGQNCGLQILSAH
jgi:hypothetical protein